MKKPRCPECEYIEGESTPLLKAYVFRPKPTYMSSKKKEMIGYWCEECGILWSEYDVR